ncbi:hypothetical protein MgSA37_01643 [Mucilaginibacter gotjawali]|uniref:Uncharacterized protein n=2 Tax=Mucilaginibacter gotjawali TaxID=1550579 RepID=A0A839SFV5_9SPHI|nr:hypothetical protein [Mucilaginibacter gotjawali]BAU53475.1 hypothetical protein MgSA37_01643 [Mucilaginibacter gotjawali]
MGILVKAYHFLTKIFRCLYVSARGGLPAINCKIHVLQAHYDAVTPS